MAPSLQPVSGHLLNGAAIALAAILALAAELYSRSPAGVAAAARPVDGFEDAEFLTAANGLTRSMHEEVVLRVDPFGGGSRTFTNSVARRTNTSTVSASAGSQRQLTAILVANDRPVAVIGDEVVGVGDLLPDGARVSRIQSDRVFLIEKDGKWRTLTLAQGRP